MRAMACQLVFLAVVLSMACWSASAQTAQKDASVIALEYGTTEMPGLEALCGHLAETFPETPFEYFKENVKPWTVAGST